MAYIRITEAGTDTRISEAGDTRIAEQSAYAPTNPFIGPLFKPFSGSIYLVLIFSILFFSKVRLWLT